MAMSVCWKVYPAKNSIDCLTKRPDLRAMERKTNMN